MDKQICQLLTDAQCILPLCIFVFFIAFSSPGYADGEQNLKNIQVSQDIQKAIHEKGYARIIVSLNMNFQPEGTLSAPEQLEKQRRKIAKMQEKFLTGLRGAFLPLKEKKFLTVPLVAIYANEAVLKHIASNRLVNSIELDMPDSLDVPGALDVPDLPDTN